jgi:hypothetical protein
LGWVLIKREKYAEGEPMLAAARSRLLAAVGARHAATQEATNRLVDYYRLTHRDAEAQKVLDETAKHQDGSRGAPPPIAAPDHGKVVLHE